MRRAILFGSFLCCAILVMTRKDFGKDDKKQVASPKAGTADRAELDGNASENGGASPEFNQAGVCARCHVVSVLEWSISGHVAAATNCQHCHGASLGHVANERNEVKPDRLPRGEAIAAQVCSSCHDSGCPETEQAQNCQQCHHVHALINPAQPRETNNRLDQLLIRWRQSEQHITNGDGHAQSQDWSRALAEFRKALEFAPGNPQARKKLQMCLRRLRPSLSGFDIVSSEVDDETGLPREVSIVDFSTPMLLVRPGTFDIGADDMPPSRPAHSVTVDVFYLAQHEVSQGLWTTVMGGNPSAHQGEGFTSPEQLPVERVSWDDCQRFLKRLNSRVPGGGFRLPTEAEWEYACGAGGSRPAPDSSALSVFSLQQRAWYLQNSLRVEASSAPTTPIASYAPRPVGAQQPNGWGFYDMQGNVAEWTSSLFRPYLYDSSDGRESLTAKGMRVLRGGGYADSAASLDQAARHAERPDRRLRWNGLRLARDVPSLSDGTTPQ
jgi:formylglycine-generating enzyme required for sulfatase activity